MQQINKCIKTVLPRSSTHIFSQDERTGELRFENKVVQDEERRDASGYVITHYGDSGMPYWRSAKQFARTIANWGRAVLISIVSSSVGPKFDGQYMRPRATYNTNPKYICRGKASKVTEDVVLWVKQKAGIPAR